ncbi:protein translocase subunit SecD, partial [Candidatus Woesearchaeota archaeon]|nr:protein translocase subunit SecD [Candidatus Woesearchaeota archaeon]
RGKPTTGIQISGSGTGPSEQAAVTTALQNMKNLQSILQTGSLPVKLNIVKTDAISPILGAAFIQNAMYVGLFAILAVVLVVFIRYRKLAISIPMIITMLSEALIIFGFAAIIGWNIDLAAIAGVIIAIGTGVDHQIVIVDETLRGEAGITMSWKDKLKRAFFIIMAAYFTTVVAMIPLWFAGAGLLKGFAITTVIGASIGVFITRPAFAAMAEMFLNRK